MTVVLAEGGTKSFPQDLTLGDPISGHVVFEQPLYVTPALISETNVSNL